MLSSHQKNRIYTTVVLRIVGDLQQSITHGQSGTSSHSDAAVQQADRRSCLDTSQQRTCAYLPQTTLPPGVTSPSSLTFTCQKCRNILIQLAATI